MIDVLPSSDTAVFLVGYALAAAIAAVLKHAEFKRAPDKRARYQALPMRYKALCWLVVLPLFAGTLIAWWLLLPAMACLLLVEGLCIRWYRSAGLW